MGKSKRSLIGHLTLTAWESWGAEPHWRNAVIIALVGTIALFVAQPKPSAPSYSAPNSGGQNTSSPMPASMANSNATILAPTSKAPPKLKPKISTDEVIINKTQKKEPENNFGRSYGEK